MVMKEHTKGLLLMLVVVMSMGVAGNIDNQTVTDAKPAPLSVKEQRLAEFFAKHGSPHPVELAQAVAPLKRPRLAAAQAVVETGGNKDLVGRASERGVWQIIEREWSAVPQNLRLQAQQYEQIMEQMIREERGRLRQALSRYNSGHPTKSLAYADKVMGLVKELKI